VHHSLFNNTFVLSFLAKRLLTLSENIIYKESTIQSTFLMFRQVIRLRGLQRLRNPSWRIWRDVASSGVIKPAFELRQSEEVRHRHWEDPREVRIPDQARREDKVLEKKILRAQKWNPVLLEVAGTYPILHITPPLIYISCSITPPIYHTPCIPPCITTPAFSNYSFSPTIVL